MNSDSIRNGNLLRMAFYAGVPMEEVEDMLAAHEAGASFVELLTSLLANAIERLRSVGLERGYAPEIAMGSHPRGRLLMGDSCTRLSLARNHLVHEHDLFDIDTPDNRVLKSTALTLLRVQESESGGVQAEDQAVLSRITREMRNVPALRVSRRTLASLPRSIASRRYRTVRFVARLLVDQAEPHEVDGTDWARRLLQDPVRMRKVFERFVFRYSRTHAPGRLRIRKARYEWPEAHNGARDRLLPSLHTDMNVCGPGWTRIVECKYTPRLYSKSLHGERHLDAGHLRQLHAYMSREQASGSAQVCGLLLYPLGAEELDHRTSLGTFPVRVVTLDLAQDWDLVCARLRSVVFDRES